MKPQRHDSSNPAGQPRGNPPLMTISAARRCLISLLGILAVIQLILLLVIGNGLSHFDNFDEADTVRAGEAYATEGFTLHHGLARYLYGHRFPGSGAFIDHLDTNGVVKSKYLAGYPAGMNVPNEWVYMHYPPGSEYICGILARLLGTESIWLWRLFPISLGFVSVLVLYRVLSRAFGEDRAVLIALACTLLPMTLTYMPGLYYENYTYVLQLFEICLIIHWFWNGGMRWWSVPTLFIMGFFQGWLSFDLFFVVAFAAVPLWLLRKAEGTAMNLRELGLSVATPLAGFGLAHFLHLLQLAGELRSFPAAIHELTQTAVDRSGETIGIAHFNYLKSFLKMSYLYVREFLRLYNPHFGPLLLLAMVAAYFTAAFRTTRLKLWATDQHEPWVFSLHWPGTNSLWPPLGAAFLVCALWPIAEPGANVGNFHIYPRDFFFFYFILVLTVVRSIQLSRPAQSQPT